MADVYDPRRDATLDVWQPHIPGDAATRGMFFHNIVDALKRSGHPPPSERYIAFKHYGLEGYWALMREAARVLFPTEPESFGVFELAKVVYPNFATSILGRAIFAVAGKDFGRIVSVAPRAYAASNSRGHFDIKHLDDHSCVVRLHDHWDPVPFSAGIWQGALDVCEVQATRFHIEVHGPGDITLDVAWAA